MKYSLKQLKESRGKSLRSMFRILFRKHINERITWFLANFTNVTPSKVSSFGILCGVISAISFFFGNLLFGAIFYELRLIMDDVDGDLARLKGLTSRFGKFMDNYSGWASNVLVSIGLCFGMFRLTGSMIFLYLCPLLVFVVYFHGSESAHVAVLLSGRFRSSVLGKSSDESKEKGLIWKFVNKLRGFLSKYNMAEPLCLTDCVFLAWVVAPILEYFISGAVLVMLLFMISIMLLREVFYFFFYRSVLLRVDEEHPIKEE